MIKVRLQSYCICRSYLCCLILWSIYYFFKWWGKEIQTLLHSKAVAHVYNIFFIVCNCKSLWVKNNYLINHLYKHLSVSHLNSPSGQMRSCSELWNKIESNSISNVRTKQQHLNIMGNWLTKTTKCKKISISLSRFLLPSLIMFCLVYI